MNFYNEHDRNAAAWIEELISVGEIADGVIDSRDVQLLGPDDHFEQYDQAHFFCGIAGWPHALDLAKWPRDRPIWTASLPCQPFSDAGKSLGVDDERHLWPVFHGLVEHYRPECIVGEQVASKAGRAWFSTVQADLAAMGYWAGAIDICAAGIGGPHIRQRLYWCAVRFGHAEIANWRAPCRKRDAERDQRQTRMSRGNGGLADGCGAGLEVLRKQPARQELASAERGSPDSWGDVVYVPCADGKSRPLPRIAQSCPEQVAARFPAQLVRGSDPGAPQVAFPPLVTQQTDNLNDTSEARTMRLKGYGNAIVAPLAAEFIATFMEIIDDHRHHAGRQARLGIGPGRARS